MCIYIYIYYVYIYTSANYIRIRCTRFDFNYRTLGSSIVVDFEKFPEKAV